MAVGVDGMGKPDAAVLKCAVVAGVAVPEVWGKPVAAGGNAFEGVIAGIGVEPCLVEGGKDS
jgi:hypothetical protein